MRALRYIRKNEDFLKVTAVLNTAFFVSALGDRLWAFSVGILMHRIGGITWVAIHQLTDAGLKLALATIVGDILDKVNRSKGIQAVLAVNNLCITASAFCFYLFFAFIPQDGSLVSMSILFSAILGGSISRVASDAQKMAFTKDWIVVLIKKSKGARLSTQNGIMNMLDQAACFVAPIVAGRCLDTLSAPAVCLLIMGWNIVSWIIEGSALLWVYSITPELSEREDAPEETEEEKASNPFQKYFRQKAFRAMFGLSLLYMTVLGFDTLAISYGASQGMSATQLGFFRSMGSLLGFAGNGVYAMIEPFIGVLLTGFIGLTIQNIFINFCSVSTFLPGNPFNATGYVNSFSLQSWYTDVVSHILNSSTVVPMETTDISPTESLERYIPFNQLPISIVVFFIGITTARFGLWLADPAITQIMQETIPESERYSVNAAQNVFCEFFSILKDILVILFPSTQFFNILIIMSCMFVFSGFALYVSYFVENFTCGKTKPEEQELHQIVPEKQELLTKQTLVDHALAAA